jgi:hypothetical protein
MVRFPGLSCDCSEHNETRDRSLFGARPNSHGGARQITDCRPTAWDPIRSRGSTRLQPDGTVPVSTRTEIRQNTCRMRLPTDQRRITPQKPPKDMSLSKFGTTGRRATGLCLPRISVGLYQLLALDLLRWGLRHLLRRVDTRELYGVQSMRNGLRQAGCVYRVDLPVRLYCQVRQSLLPPMTLPTFSG